MPTAANVGNLAIISDIAQKRGNWKFVMLDM